MKKLDRETAGIMVEDDHNPFRISDLNVDLFRLREEEKCRREKAREENRKLKVWQKGRSGPLKERTPATRIKEFMKEKTQDASNQGQPRNCNEKIDRCMKKIEQYAMSDLAEEKETSMADFIAKKREMFLLQMSLDTKTQEIRKLEDRTKLKEEALQRSERMLEEDAIRFDAFLKENDKKAQDAIRQSERETKKKMDKVQEIKKLNQQIQGVQSDISKHNEALEDCLGYKKFLDQLTPLEWTEEQISKKRERQKNRRKSRIRKQKEKWREEQEKIIAEAKAKEEADKANRKRHRRRRQGKNNPDNCPPVEQREALLEPDFEDEPLTSSDEELPMYFNKPQQLLDLFSGLEQENLFLIQNTQESEQCLEELDQNVSSTRADMENSSEALEGTMSALQRKISNETEKVAHLNERTQRRSGDAQRNNKKLLGALDEKVREIYEHCGFSDAGSTPSTIVMLSDIEASMEKILSSIEQIPPESIRKAEKVKEKKRRELKRAQQQAAQEKAQEERNAKAIERSLQPPKKRTGRQVMYRSQPIRQKVCETKTEVTQEEIDQMRHLT